jgi:hypothetical protein
MYIFGFTRTFTKGHLAGITVNDYIRFPSHGKFMEWVAGVNLNHQKGRLESFVTPL